jgi:hypothetical protein
MYVDEPRADDESLRVDRLACLVRRIPYGGDTPINHTHCTCKPLSA